MPRPENVQHKVDERDAICKCLKFTGHYRHDIQKCNFLFRLNFGIFRFSLVLVEILTASHLLRSAFKIFLVRTIVD